MVRYYVDYVALLILMASLQTAMLYVASYLSLCRVFISSLDYLQHTKKPVFYTA